MFVTSNLSAPRQVIALGRLGIGAALVLGLIFFQMAARASHSAPAPSSFLAAGAIAFFLALLVAVGIAVYAAVSDADGRQRRNYGKRYRSQR